MPTFKLSVINDEISQDFGRACEVAAQDFGVQLVEIRAMWGKNIMRLDAKEIDEARKILEKYKLSVSSIASPIFKVDWPGAPTSKFSPKRDQFGADFTFEQQDELLERGFELVRVFHVDRIRIFDFWRLDDQKPYRAAIDKKLIEASKKAARRGITLLLENEPSCNTATGAEAARTLGAVVTRGFPLEPRAGERVDHPHHAGFWLNYGNVNGLDFWNNSVALPPEQQQKMGTVVLRRITQATGGKDRGQLAVETEWVMPDGQPILREATTFVFRAAPDLRAVDRITTLTALDKRVLFHDDKEGMLGMRVRRELEQPSNEPLVFTDSSGRPTTVRVLDNTGVTGQYRSSEGKTGDAVWGHARIGPC
jgi:hypothetical protein